jgi:hypothetical protein
MLGKKTGRAKDGISTKFSKEIVRGRDGEGREERVRNFQAHFPVIDPNALSEHLPSIGSSLLPCVIDLSD